MHMTEFTVEAAASDAGEQSHPLEAGVLVAQLASEVAGTLSSALERVAALAATGRIDRAGLRALRDEVQQARQACIMGQQVVRLARSHLPLARERLDLSSLLREALRLRGREIASHGIEVRQVFAAAEVRSDVTLLYSLLEALLDWSFVHAASRIDLGLAVRDTPPQARLTVAFAHRPADEVATAPAPLDAEEAPALNTMAWCLVQQTAAVLGLPVTRRDPSGRTAVSIDFPDTLPPRAAGPDPQCEPDSVLRFHDSQPLAGRHVVVLAVRREVRRLVREALRPMSLMLDFVSSVDEAQRQFAEALPHAVVYEAALGGRRLDRLRDELQAEVPALAFIEIAEQGHAFEVSNVGGRQCASVGRDAIVHALPAALLFELTRHA